ncbi:MAG: hypothetical protein ACRC2T_04840, partial [Thermoguttaceae bacterium]
MQKKRFFAVIIIVCLIILPFVIRGFRVSRTVPLDEEQFVSIVLPENAEQSYYFKPCFSPDGQTFLIVDGTAIQKIFATAPFPP